MNLLQNLVSKLRRKPTNEEMAILELYRSMNFTNEHLIAMARLMFIKPEALVREAKNVKSNAEYLLKMLEEGKKNETKTP